MNMAFCLFFMYYDMAAIKKYADCNTGTFYIGNYVYYYGIQDVRKIEAVGLDLYGANVDLIMRDAEETLLDIGLV